MNYEEQFELKLGGRDAFIAAGKEIGSKDDAMFLFRVGDIMVKDDLIVWLEPTYPNVGGVMSEIKRKAGESRLMLSRDGAIYEVECAADWDWGGEEEMMYEGYQKGLRGDELEEYLYES